MAAPAPGQSPSQNEPVCYNCGGKGHWVMACPEPIRSVPSGLRNWQSRKQDPLKSVDKRHGPPRDKKGPVITRYPPPPSQGPTITRYGPQPPPPFAAGPPPPVPPQAHQAYAPEPYSTAQPYPPYPPPHPPPTPYASPYPPPPGPHGPPPPVSYGPPPPYGQAPPPYGPPPYPSVHDPSPGYYPPPPQPQYPAPSYQAPVPIPPPAAYPPPPYPSAGPPPAGPIGPPGPAGPLGNLPHSYSPVSYPPPLATSYVPPHLPHPVHASIPLPLPISSSHQPFGTDSPTEGRRHHDRKSHHKQKRRKSPSRGLHNRQNKQRDSFRRDSSQKGPRSRSASPKPDSRPVAPPAKVTPAVTPKPEEAELRPREGDFDWDPELKETWDLIFPDVKTIPADSVGIPLPLQYTDEPTIPPAYDAKCIKSSFFNAKDREQFCVSVQLSPEWPLLIEDPAFKQYPGMIMRRFDSCAVMYATYEPTPRHPLSKPVKMPPRYRRQHLHPAFKEGGQLSPSRRDRSPAGRERSPGKHLSPLPHYRKRDRSSSGRDIGWDRRRPDPSSGGGGKYLREETDAYDDRPWDKRRRNSPSRPLTPERTYRGTPLVRQYSDSPLVKVEEPSDAWAPQVGEGSNWIKNEEDDTGRSSTLLDVGLDRRERDNGAYMRNDSGYHSGQSQERREPWRNGHDREDDHSRVPRDNSSRRDHQDRSLEPRSRSRSPPHRAPSRASSQTPSDRERSSSPLTALEAQLLGQLDPDDDDEDEEERLAQPKRPPPRKLQKKDPKVAKLFGRRW